MGNTYHATSRVVTVRTENGWAVRETRGRTCYYINGKRVLRWWYLRKLNETCDRIDLAAAKFNQE